MKAIVGMFVLAILVGCSSAPAESTVSSQPAPAGVAADTPGTASGVGETGAPATGSGALPPPPMSGS